MLTRPQQYITKKVGETALLECAASGLPIPLLLWVHQVQNTGQ